MMSTPNVNLSRFERAALALSRFTNESPAPKRALHWYLYKLTPAWIKLTVGPRFFVDGLDRIRAMHPDRGVMFVANHRSFFDMYVVMLAMFWQGRGWTERLFFPVRSNFFYEHPTGVLLNYALGGGSMYPPIFRDPAKSELNRVALDTVIRLLAQPGVMVGMHPEGTRGKGPDPYELLPAQPGVGQMILAAKPIVIPLFINGLSNDFIDVCRSSYQKGVRREKPVSLVFGEPIDYSQYAAQKPRAALYKKTADLVREKILEVGQRDRELREQMMSGQLDDDPRWLFNMPR
jgi:1-acyl-sn-glycerol-3-phosphate acyltransferase